MESSVKVLYTAHCTVQSQAMQLYLYDFMNFKHKDTDHYNVENYKKEMKINDEFVQRKNFLTGPDLVGKEAKNN